MLPQLLLGLQLLSVPASLVVARAGLPEWRLSMYALAGVGPLLCPGGLSGQSARALCADGRERATRWSQAAWRLPGLAPRRAAALSSVPVPPLSGVRGSAMGAALSAALHGVAAAGTGDAVISGVALERLTALFLSVGACYPSPSHLVVGDVTIPSAQGGQQGDPVVPALFSLAAHHAVLEALAEAELATGRPSHITAFFLDAGPTAGDASTVRKWRQALISCLYEPSLTPIRAKCRAVPRGGSPELLARGLGAQSALMEGSSYSDVPSGASYFCDALTAKRSDKAQHTKAQLCGMEGSRSVFLPPRDCVKFWKLVYSPRTTPRDAHWAGLAAYG